MTNTDDSAGIITKYTLRTYPIGEVWGGYRIYSTNTPEIYKGLHEFISSQKDPKAAVIVNS